MTEQLSFGLGEERPDILQWLTAEQRDAVEHGDGPLLIVAGAGTGKTHVLTARIVQLIASGRAKPHEILALTFTEKAAATMQERVDLYTPLGLNDVMAGHVAVMFADVGSVVGHINAGKVRGLGVSSTVRVPALPNLRRYRAHRLP